MGRCFWIDGASKGLHLKVQKNQSWDSLQPIKKCFKGAAPKSAEKWGGLQSALGISASFKGAAPKSAEK